MLKTSILLLLLFSVGCHSSDSNSWTADDGGMGGADSGGSDTDDVDEGPQLVKGLSITEVAIYQAVKIGLMKDGELIKDRPVPIVAGKDALLRIFIKRQDRWNQRKIIARLEFKTPNEKNTPDPIEIRPIVSFDSLENKIDTTLNFDIPGDYIVEGLRYSVSLFDLEKNLDISEGNKKSARWPVENTKPLESESDGNRPLEIVIIPVRYNADGSGRLPDTSEGQLNAIRDAFYSQYPVSKVNLIVGDPLDWSQSISAMGNGWSNLLTRISQERSSRGASRNQYYYGLFSPSASFGQFCGMGCVLGLSVLATQPTDDWARSSIGLGFLGGETVGTIIHEVGHAHGREHAPCGLGGQASDPGYPNDAEHANAAIGYPGYDLRNETWKSPTTKDFMSYCSPTWISEYTYNALFERVKAVNALAKFIPPVMFETQWLSISIDFEGGLSAGPSLELWAIPGGNPEQIEWLDEDDNSLGTDTAYFHAYSHLDGGLLLFPSPPQDVASVLLSDGRKFELSDF